MPIRPALVLAALSPLVQEPAPGPSPVPEQGAYAIVGATLVDPDGAPSPDRTVLVRAGRIESIEADGAPVPEGYQRIDGRGRYLCPGLAEMHGHLPGEQASAEFAEDVLFLYLANGVTTVRGMLGDPRQLELRERVAAGELAGPQLFVGSPPLHGGAVTNAVEARRRVHAYAEARYDHLKVHENLAPEVYDAIVETAADVGLPFGGHVSDLVGLRRALEAGPSTIDHLDNLVEELLPPGARERHGGVLQPDAVAGEADPDRLPGLVTLVRDSGAAVVPTLALWETFLGGTSGEELAAQRPEVRYVPRAMVDQWIAQVDQMRTAIPAEAGRRVIELRRLCLHALAEGGVPVLLGTDSPQLFSVPGFSMRREVRAMVAAGLSPAEVLRSGTTAVARFYREGSSARRVAVGARADLLLLDADPLEDVGNLFAIAGVLADGRWYPRERLDARLEEIAARAGS